MIQKLRLNKVLWLLTGVLALGVSSISLLKPEVYDLVVISRVLPGTISQDLITILASVVTIILVLRMKEEDAQKQIIILGLMGFFFYAYGIYVIERLYNILYFFYMAIFALSFYSIVYGIASIKKEAYEKVKVSKAIRRLSVTFLFFISIMFSFLWISKLVPLIQNSEKIEFMYAIFILDLCFIVPALTIIAFMTATNKGLGLILAPAAFVIGCTLLFSVGLGEILKPIFFDQSINPGEMSLYLVVSTFFLLLSLLHLSKLKFAKLS